MSNKNITSNSCKTRTHFKYELVYEKSFILRSYRYETTIDCEKPKKTTKLIEKIDYPLVAISREELFKKRMNIEDAGFVFKNEYDLFYTKIPKTTNFIASPLFSLKDKPHMCAHSENLPNGGCCNHLSALPTKLGGCDKVFCRSVKFYLSKNYSITDAVMQSERIEKFDFIKIGYESFNTDVPFICVLNCTNYEDVPKRKKLPKNFNANKSKLALAQFVWPDVSSRKEVLQRIRDNENNI